MNTEAATQAVAHMKDVRRIYRMGSEEVKALDGVSFDVQPGEYWSIMGASGSGKSTLLNVVGCLDRPSSGTYRLGGEDVNTLSDDELSEMRSRRLGFIFQSYNLIAQLDVLENIMVPLFYQDEPPADGEDRARRLAERMGLGERLGHRPNELSGGQQQRVAIARSLVNDPDLILADEATGNLDSQTANEILDLFDELSREGKTILFVTHESHVAERASHVLRMRDGRIEEIIDQRSGAQAT
ncbi:MAG: putative ABC transport system ATP-binding protein [Pseudohongiellaceae bacterium]|jgi:putative ABC transport system ATP-binding protein